MTAASVDQEFMAQAIRLGRRGLYSTDPNPRVGCVLVRGGKVVGEGWHRRAGEPHAERNAIAEAGGQARGSSAYVTLEPCCHQGRTPPCTDALLEAGVKRVVAAMVDPNPLVAGKGLEMLRAQGVAVEVGVLGEQARELNLGFVKRLGRGLPYVRCKMAASLDGRTATASGESKWITSEAARRDVQLLRARSSAILTGVGTLLADDPSMNVRLEAVDLPGMESGQAVRQPLRVLVDSRLRTPENARMLGLPGRTLIACVDPDPARAARLESEGVSVCVCAESRDRVDLESLLRDLARREINEVLIEAGPTLAGAALQEGFVDEIVLYLAPHVMGEDARGLFRLSGLKRIQDRVALDIRDVRMVGSDLRISAFPARSA